MRWDAVICWREHVGHVVRGGKKKKIRYLSTLLYVLYLYNEYLRKRFVGKFTGFVECEWRDEVHRPVILLGRMCVEVVCIPPCIRMIMRLVVK